MADAPQADPLSRQTLMVETPQFSGSLSDLVHFVRKGDIPIWDLLCSSVTEQIARQAEHLPLDQAGLAIALGAWLPRAKSKALLLRCGLSEVEPGVPERDPEVEDEDPELRRRRVALERQLVDELSELMEETACETSRRPAKGPLEAHVETAELVDPRDLTLDDLIAELDAVQHTLMPLDRFRVSEVMAEIARRLEEGSVRLDDLAGKDIRKQVAAFLATLELLKEQRVRAVQESQFGPIEVHRR